MEKYKIEITIDNLDLASYTGIMSALKNITENSKHKIKVCDGKKEDAIKEMEDGRICEKIIKR